MRRNVVIILLTLGLTRAAFGDVVELKTGQRVEGTFKGADDSAVKIEVGGQTVTFKPEQVRAIYYGAAPNAAAQPSSRDEAMKSLKGLRSVAQGGVTYRDYAPRVSDAKIVVDRYLGESKGEASTLAIASAMDLYVFASSAWNTRITDSFPGIKALGLSPTIAQCEPLKLTIASTPLRPGNTGPGGPEYQAGITIMGSMGVVPLTVELG